MAVKRFQSLSQKCLFECLVEAALSAKTQTLTEEGTVMLSAYL